MYLASILDATPLGDEALYDESELKPQGLPSTGAPIESETLEFIIPKTRRNDAPVIGKDIFRFPAVYWPFLYQNQLLKKLYFVMTRIIQKIL